jgi:hypothetical protein
MKIRTITFWSVIMLLGLFGAYAADVATAAGTATATPAPTATNTLILTLIPVLVPLIVALAKWGVPKLPTWILPILAPALGAALDYLSTLATGSAANPAVGALLGSAGVGLREVVDQVKGRLKDGGPPAAGILLLCLLPAASLTVGVSGCALFQNTPAETIKYYTFLDSWTLSKAAYDGWAERVVMGKVTHDQEAKVDAAWNKYRAAFSAALGLAKQDWSAVTPATLGAIQIELLNLIKSFTTQ